MKISLLLIFLLLTCKGQKNDIAEETVPPFDIVQAVVPDNSNLFSTTQKDALSQRLTEYEVQTTNQVVIITVDSITPYTNIQKYASDLANAWGVGQKGNDNGLAIVVSDKLREVSIAIGSGTEKYWRTVFAAKSLKQPWFPSLETTNITKGSRWLWIP